ncbi:MAG: hypothetical protein SPJ29_08370 [Phocaeicola sp.]|nr:plasmid pRiA4b ORF-3 family protein [Phocaeicola sp.]MDD7447707.1 hypothetical protein [Prevotellaceae bacterium]MDY3913658.1 hypothetical protein [Phocaeicola sp.]MDY5939731.1 hypothetical protein [Phocaeicola sp.]
MVYKFRIISDEVEDFLREICIDAEDTFFDLHLAILDSVGYKNDQMTSFFTCTDGWEKEREVTLEDMGGDAYLMEETKIEELLEDEKQRLIYVFDPLAERVFFMELSKIMTGKSLDAAECTKSIGEAPVQTIDFEEQMAQLNKGGQALDLDEDLYGDLGYNDDEIDPEGYDLLDESSFSYNDENY